MYMVNKAWKDFLSSLDLPVWKQTDLVSETLTVSISPNQAPSWSVWPL